MGSTAAAATITRSTFVGPVDKTLLSWTNVTSSGGYFEVGDASKTVVLVMNASSSEVGTIWVEPGAKWGGSRSLAVGTTTSTAYSTASVNIPICSTFTSHGVTGSSAMTSSLAIAAYLFESAMVKTTDSKVYITATTQSTKMYVAVLALPGGSTN